MDGDKDNGYHSNDNELEADSNELDSEEIHVFDDLEYEDTTLEEPDYDVARSERFQRNKEIMKNVNPYLLKTMSDDSTDRNGYLTQSREDNAAIAIQKHIRRFLAQKLYVGLLMEQFEKNEKLRSEKTMEQMEEAALLIENHKLEVQFEDYNVVRKNKLQRLICYVITIQRGWRKFCKKKDERIRREKDDEDGIAHVGRESVNDLSIQYSDLDVNDPYEEVAANLVQEILRNLIHTEC